MPFKSKEAQQNYYQNNKKRLRKQQKAYSYANSARNKKRCKDYFEKNKEKMNAQSRKYYAAHKEELNKKNREYRQKNKEKLNAQSRAYRKTHKKECNLAKKKYLLAHPEIKIKMLKKMASKSQELKLIIFKHYCPDLKCKCGVSDYRTLELDHINGGGGKHRLEIRGSRNFYNWIIKNNFPPIFQILCANCHRIKHCDNPTQRKWV